MSPKRRDERGVIAVVFALAAALIFGMAAIGVDLGNAMNRKKQLQTDADFAALAGGADLPAPTLTPTSSDAVVLDVADYLLKNRVYDDSGASLPTKSVLAQKLVSNLPADMAKYGHVYYGWFDAIGNLTASRNYVTVVAPQTQVNFGIATAIGFTSTKVKAVSTAAIKSIGSIGATLPFYAYDGCDWGQQVISHSTGNATAPALAYPNDDNGITVNPSSTASPNANPNQLVLNDTSTTITVSGSGLTASTAPADTTKPGVISLGFFRSDGSSPVEVPAGSFLAGSGASQILVKVPGSVASVNGSTYYLRVSKWVNTGNANHPNYQKQWSAVSTSMAYVEVGDATLFCNDDKSAGNFGSLSIFRTDSSNNQSTGWLPLNIAKGIDLPHVLLNKYTAVIDSNTCNNGDSNAFQSDDSASGVKVNCVVTDTGFPQNPATNGFITGVSTSPVTPGRLTNVSSGCGGVSGAPPIRTLVGSVQINNEILTCYLTDSTTTLASVSNENYSGGVVFRPDIYSSPRFFWVPVINSQPQNGKKSFPIVDFRAAFMTGENGTAFMGHAALGSYYADDPTTNGLVVSGNNANSLKVESFRVTFINPKALPPVPGNGVPVDYIGSGPKILLLVN